MVDINEVGQGRRYNTICEAYKAAYGEYKAAPSSDQDPRVALHSSLPQAKEEYPMRIVGSIGPQSNS